MSEGASTLGGMPDPARGGLRFARLGAFVVACLGLGAAGHAVGGGGVPTAPTMLLTIAPLTLLGLWFTHRERGVWGLFAALTVVEAALHVVFHAAHAADPAAGVAAAVAARAGHAGHAGSDLAQASGHAGHLSGLPADGLLARGMLPSGSMLAAHLIAIAVTALALGWGDRSLWAMARRLFPVLAAAVRPAYPLAIRQPTTTPAPLRATDVLRHAPVRGPPLGLRPA